MNPWLVFKASFILRAAVARGSYFAASNVPTQLRYLWFVDCNLSLLAGEPIMQLTDLLLFHFLPTQFAGHKKILILCDPGNEKLCNCFHVLENKIDNLKRDLES
jgi:hypothetical protein